MKKKRNLQMSISDFIYLNEEDYVQDYLESCPEDAYLVNDWDLSEYQRRIYNRLDIVEEDMAECYIEHLQSHD